MGVDRIRQDFLQARWDHDILQINKRNGHINSVPVGQSNQTQRQFPKESRRHSWCPVSVESFPQSTGPSGAGTVGHSVATSQGPERLISRSSQGANIQYQSLEIGNQRFPTGKNRLVDERSSCQHIHTHKSQVGISRNRDVDNHNQSLSSDLVGQ